VGLFNAPWKAWEAKNIAERHTQMDELVRNDSTIRDVHRLYQVFDSKSAALAQHVSIMIAACTLLASLAGTSPHGRLLYLILTALYLCITLMVLKILDFNMYNIKDSDLADQVAARAYFATAAEARGRAYRWALSLTAVLTVLAIALIMSDIVQRAAACMTKTGCPTS
jgi:hypothetical protein